MNEWRLKEITYKIVEDRRYEVAVLPIGAIEPHNLHLPHGADFFQAEMIADIACEKAWNKGAKILLLPAIPYGVDANMIQFPMAMHVSQFVLNQVVMEIMKSVEAHSIPKFIIVNHHGGNEFKSFVRDLPGKTSLFVTLIDSFRVALDIHRELFVHDGDHGDESETSICMHLVPHLVHLEDADAGETFKTRFEFLNKGLGYISRPWHLFTKNTGVGDPRLATAEKGKKYVAVITDRMAQYFKELSDTPIDETFPYGSEAGEFYRKREKMRTSGDIGHK